MLRSRVTDATRDAEAVVAQAGRKPRGRWRTAARCRHGFPQVIATAPMLDDTTPFPTLFWLTCPSLVREVSARESEGEVAAWAGRLARDPALARRQMAADAAYREARTAEGGGIDPCDGAGTAGQRDPLATKCLHAHVAARLGGIDDAVGEAVLASSGRGCRGGECDARVAQGKCR